MTSRIYSAVVDCAGIFPSQAQNLVWSLTHLAGVAPEQIVLHVTNMKVDPVQYKNLQTLGVEIVEVDSYPGHPYCNKLQQLLPLMQREFEDVVLLDCDVLVLQEPPPAQGGALAKPVDFSNPEIEYLEKIFNAAMLTLIPSKTDIDGLPTALGNANGGVYVISRRVFGELANEWRHWAAWCFEHREMFGEKWIHIDQVSFSMAITSLQIPFREMHRRFNFPTHVPQAVHLDCEPSLLHYHRAVDDQQLLLPVPGLEQVNHAIQFVNQELLRFRRESFDNASFWNVRYKLHPALGSGVGSRDGTLELKREILNEIVRVLTVRTILDVGGGDGQTMAKLPVDIALSAIDVAASSKDLYVASVPQASWSQHDITVAPTATDADLVVCLDLLIHISRECDYQAAVRNLLLHDAPVLVSGFEAAPVEYGPMTWFHEPLSSTIKRNGFVPVPINSYRGLTVFLGWPLKKPTNTNDATRETIERAISFVSNPALLLEAVTCSREKLGFFPNHLPRCIEYPWIVEQLSNRKPLRVIDAGAGVSVLSFMLANRGHIVTTVDPHPLVRNIAERDTWNEWGYLDYSLLDESIKSLHMPYQDMNSDFQVDAVVSVSVIEHLSASLRSIWINKAFSQLLPGGFILLTVDTVPFSNFLWNYCEGKQVEDPCNHGNIEDLANELAVAGFVNTNIEHLQWLPMSRVGMARIRATKPTPLKRDC